MRWWILILTLLIAAGCGGNQDTSFSTGPGGGQTEASLVNVPVRVDFAGPPSRVLSASLEALAPADTFTFTIEVYLAPGGPLLTRLDRILRTPPDTLSQTTQVNSLPPVPLILRVVCFGRDGTPLGFSDQTFTPASGQTIGVVTFTAGAPAPVSPSPSPTPSPVFSPSPGSPPSGSPAASPGASPSPSPALSPAAPILRSLTVTPASTMLARGATQTYTATATFSDGSTSVVTSRATWTTSSATVAVISASGVATATGGGTTSVMASFQGQTGSAPLTVTGAPLRALVISPGGFTLSELQTLQLQVLGQYTDGTTGDLTGLVSYASDSGAIIVGPTGLVFASVRGSATLTASLGALSASILGTVLSVTGPPAPPPAPVGRLYVGFTQTIWTFQNAYKVNGSPAFSTAITGLTQANQIALDVARNILYVADTGANQVVAVSPADSPTPSKRILTGINSPFGIAVDSARDLLYVGTRSFAGDNVFRLTGASAQSGVVVAASVVNYGVAGPAPSGISIDTQNDVLYVGARNFGPDGFIDMIPSASSASLVTAAGTIRIAGPATTLTGLNNPQGVSIANQRLWVTGSFNNLGLEFASPFQGALGTTRNVAPDLTVTDPRVSGLQMPLYDGSRDELYMSDNSGLIFIYLNATGLVTPFNGPPTRLLDFSVVNPGAPGFDTPVGLALDPTR